MILTFNLNYHTAPGQYPVVDAVRDGERSVVEMQSVFGGNWSAAIDCASGVVEYKYRIAGGGEEWGEPRRVVLPEHQVDVQLIDCWRERPDESPFFSTAFSDSVFRRDDSEDMRLAADSLTLIISAPGVSSAQRLLICGNTQELGSWNPADAAVMTPGKYPQWHYTVKSPAEELQYKFLICDEHGTRHWERTNNRQFLPATFGGNPAIVNDCGTFANPLPRQRYAGTAIPVFSLRSDDDCGIGDFEDIRLMADWAAAAGQRFLQLLPVNDTTAARSWADSYPYNAISSFALNPIYLRPEAVGTLTDSRRRKHYRAIADALNKSPEVDYERVASIKEALLRELFAETGRETLNSDEFEAFIAGNSSWLDPYAAFCVLRDRFGTVNMADWGEFAEYDEDKVATFLAANTSEADYYRWLQFHADKQLRGARNYCHSVGVSLKGDIPIGVSRCSVDAWMHPELFNLDASAGAPPDAFAKDGQNWGFPTYDWQRMAQDGYAWWKARLRKMADYFDAYRIDHLLGFFRIWQIPRSAVHGLLGAFNPALPFSVKELKDNYGFIFDRNIHAEPVINDGLLWDLFGEISGYVRDHFLQRTEWGYKLRQEYDTQRKIVDNFPELPVGHETAKTICEGLLRIVENRLFVEDANKPGYWHPRICGEDTDAFSRLSVEDKERYHCLYHDFYYIRNNSFWHAKAMEKLPPLIDSTAMLCCAEDLGMIPACVPEVMESLNMLSLKVQRMPDEPEREFADTLKYPYYCVATTSTHDMPGIRQWWEEDPQRAQRFYTGVLGLSGNCPIVAEPWICDLIVSAHLASPAMLCILPLQDWLAIDGRLRRDDPRCEQINDPANPANRWSYRMHLTLESLIAEHDFTAYLRRKTAAVGR